MSIELISQLAAMIALLINPARSKAKFKVPLMDAALTLVSQEPKTKENPFF